jgi:phosphate transport system substrate-binding protein
MKMRKFMSLILAGSLAVFALAGCGQKGVSSNSSGASSSNLSGTVATDGSTSMEKVIGALGEAFQNDNSNVKVTYNPTGSGSGITAVKEGRCDIGLSSRSLTADEKATLTETKVCLDGIAIIVNSANTVKDLTLDQITRIYDGTIKNWKDVGGSDAQIVLIGREAGSGTRDGFESITKTKEKIKYSQLK